MELLSDEVLAIFVPIVVYWVYSGFYTMLGVSVERYRLHSIEDEETKNLVPKLQVIRAVLFQQFIQASAAYFTYKLSTDSRYSGGANAAAMETEATYHANDICRVAGQFLVGMLVIDTWQYMWHRYMHLNKFLYRHIHSWHHRLVVPYSFGSQYNHPVEGLLLDTVGGVLAYLISGMSARTSIFFFSFSTIKGIDDHCGLLLPWNVFHIFFRNNTAYHDVHHQLYGNKYNFSQPFFITWDKILGTHMPYTVEERKGGGLQARPLIKKR